MAPEHRATCVEAINAFRQEHGLLPLVVCSRVADYEAVGTRLQLQGALVVQPLTRAQVETYLSQVGRPLAAVREALGEDPTLWEVLDTPLMLTIVTLAYAGKPVGAFRARGTPEARHQDLFAAYVDRMFQRRSAVTRYIRPQTERWLAWLAWQMTQHSQTLFYIEQMQPNWLPQRQRWIPTQGVMLIASLLGWLGGGLLPGLLLGVLFDDLHSSLLIGLVAGLGIGGLVGWAGSSKEITSIETVRWSWRVFLIELLLPSSRKLGTALVFGLGAALVLGPAVGLRDGLRFGLHSGLLIGLGGGLGVGFGVILSFVLGAGLGFGLSVGLGAGLNAKLVSGLGAWLGTTMSTEVSSGLFAGLSAGVLVKLGAGVVAGLSGGEIAMKTTPNEGIHRSARMAVLSGLSVGLGCGLLPWLVVGLLNWLGRGGSPSSFRPWASGSPSG